ncbi:hypothetical protein G6O67_007413 [Ophiocordyceps sinensis]|uniref:Caspase domain-containing protein n=1 Tax=Ophiocordyceps sinensis TaxID=72228 RepID=A0A8H4LUS7_9HYPO|nr:hypothetical protein G6O67_007413 [Ophiocordyceps sinensis]
MKRAATSPPPIRPRRASKRAKPIDSLQVFVNDVQSTVNQMLPTGGRRYDQAAILAINFSRSDIPSVVPLRNELLNLLDNTYNWKVERHTIDCNQAHTAALRNLQVAATTFMGKYASRNSSGASLLCVYYSGHGFRGKDMKLNICGSMASTTARAPYLEWAKIRALTSSVAVEKNDQRLVILDCCVAGLAHLDHDDFEVLCASSWESVAAGSAQASFTRAIIDELKALNGGAITTTQLISRLHSHRSVRKGVSMPVHKRALDDDRPPALIHRIEKTPAPTSAQVTAVKRHSHVLIAVKVAKENTVPNATEWARWLKTNLPPYVGEMQITAKWKTGSALVVFVLPIEIWLGLPERDAYSFIEYHGGWDAATARREQAALLVPGLQLQENRRPGGGDFQQLQPLQPFQPLREQQRPRSRDNIQPPQGQPRPDIGDNFQRLQPFQPLEEPQRPGSPLQEQPRRPDTGGSVRRRARGPKRMPGPDPLEEE